MISNRPSSYSVVCSRLRHPGAITHMHAQRHAAHDICDHVHCNCQALRQSPSSRRPIPPSLPSAGLTQTHHQRRAHACTHRHIITCECVRVPCQCKLHQSQCHGTPAHTRERARALSHAISHTRTHMLYETARQCSMRVTLLVCGSRGL